MPSETQPDLDRGFELLSRVPYGRVATSMRALPFLAAARHVVADGRLLLRMHRGYGYHQACVGSVVAYGADNLGTERPGEPGQWSVQCVGTCELIEPSTAELELFGSAPHYADDEIYEPVYLCVTPQFMTVHELRGGSAAVEPPAVRVRRP
ncbi:MULTISPECIES: pyridoxamine 5'-phosphate oxidase family protein [unclassified Streptomyces]|uniref:pyridoxamine 5'-phosphate oxidase family protein n=1 Tax=unclassified Streptomyces TaxID=2593676 RepID=UPI000DB91120|nr:MULTISPECIES: pyridoxamine 5'-phosphate oxidase family protein [unclassified Streptomyces]MYT70117.1 pyridoxamine 5'-phosphate oxidase family protein [Streptomyces sp. SID8367]RAJ88693.1 pyridoxamine 5'-phosphate oxidase-like protein [Streptomyces sp. PsTaAH-137]